MTSSEFLNAFGGVKAAYKPDILTCLANLSNDEVFTPPNLTNEVLDLLPQSLFESPDTKFLDPVCKSGVFLREIARRLMKGLEKHIPNEQERRNHIFTKQVFGIAITSLTAEMTRRSLYCSKTANGKYSVCTKFKDISGNVRYVTIPHTFKNGNCIYCGASEREYGEKVRDKLESHAYEFIHMTDKQIKEMTEMKFDVIIGNPPYQLSDGGGTGSSAVPLYHRFVEQAQKLRPRYLTMIIPSRWFTGGKGLDTFRENMLNDSRIREIHDYLNAGDVFAGVSIEGGVCYFLWNRDNKGLCKVTTHSANEIVSTTERPLLENGADVFIRYNSVISILRKVMAKKEKSFSTIVSPRNPYGIGSEVLEGVYSEYAKKVNVLGVLNSKRTIRKIPLAQLGRNTEELKYYRLFISKADGAAGQIGNPIPARIIGKIEIAEPQTACTETFLRIGAFKNKQEAENVKQYMQTRFFRLLVGARKNKNMTQNTYNFVPLQNWNEEWNDEKLYKKYNLAKEEIDFIEEMITETISISNTAIEDGDHDE